jgi:hypothetical protein
VFRTWSREPNSELGAVALWLDIPTGGPERATSQEIDYTAALAAPLARMEVMGDGSGCERREPGLGFAWQLATGNRAHFPK